MLRYSSQVATNHQQHDIGRQLSVPADLTDWLERLQSNLISACNVTVDNLSINCQQHTQVKVDSCWTKRRWLNEVIKEQRPALWIVHQAGIAEELCYFVENEWLFYHFTITVTTYSWLQPKHIRIMNIHRLAVNSKWRQLCSAVS